MHFRISQWPGLFRRGGFGAVLAALLIFLASCSATSVLTDSGPTEPKGKTVPPVIFSQVTGLPPSKLSDMKTALAVAGGQRDIGIVEGDFQAGSFALTGQFRTFAESAGVRVVYQWQLRDSEGVLVQTIDGEDNAGLPTGSDPWGAVSSSVIERIAKSTVESMAAKLAQLGYATRLSKLYEPPAGFFARASPDAHREVDFETLNGPGMAMAGLDMIAPQEDPELAAAYTEPVPGEAEMTTKAPASKPEGKQPSAEAELQVAEEEPKAGKKDGTKDDDVQIRAVAVLPVKGSPGGGDAELTAAMRKVLIDAGWQVVTKRQPDALTIVGHVKVDDKTSAQQSVSVRWEVQSPDGKMLGDVKQANKVPRGALDAGWGTAAFAVAEAAASGIFDIVNRFQ